MYINQIFELHMTLDNDKFQKVLNRAYSKADYLDEKGKEYIDRSLNLRESLLHTGTASTRRK